MTEWMPIETEPGLRKKMIVGSNKTGSIWTVQGVPHGKMGFYGGPNETATHWLSGIPELPKVEVVPIPHFRHFGDAEYSPGFLLYRPSQPPKETE